MDVTLYVVLGVLGVVAFFIGWFAKDQQTKKLIAREYAKLIEALLGGAAVEGFTVQHIRSLIKEGVRMERYRASWNPSPSPFVDKHQLVVKIDGAAEAVLVDNIAASASEVFFDVEAGKVVEVWLRTFGDNTTQKDCDHVNFVAKNEQTVQAVEDFGVNWVQHIV
jgi:hypothetical protein